MAEETINEQNEDTSPTADDYVLTWDVTSGITKKASLQSIKDKIILYNPYKFSVYRNASYTTATPAVFPFDTKTFDTNTNIDVVTNKGRFTAPVSGFYFFSACVTANSGSSYHYFLDLYKNGSQLQRLCEITTTAINWTTSGSALVQLTAGDYVEIYWSPSAATSVLTGADTWFTGFLVSQT